MKYNLRSVNMKILEWLKIKKNNLLEGTTSKLDILRNNIDDLQEKNRDISEDYYNKKGMKVFYENEIDKANEYITKLTDSARRYKAKENISNVKACYTNINNLKSKIAVYENNLKTTTEVLNKLEELKSYTDNKLSELKNKLELLKSQEQFANDVKGTVANISSFTDVADMSDIEKDISIDYEGSKIQFEDIRKDDINDLVSEKDNGFDKFMNELNDSDE